MDGKNTIRIQSWVHLVAEAIGITADDRYRDWRTGGNPGRLAIEKAEEGRYSQLVDPNCENRRLFDKRGRR